MRVWYDMEFLEDGCTIEPISLGAVAEDGREFYAVFEEAAVGTDLHERICRHPWLMENVVPHLPLRTGGKPMVAQPTDHTPGAFALDTDDVRVLPRGVVRKLFLAFLREDGLGSQIDLWAYYGAYDHVALMQLWGPMIGKPSDLPMFSHDIVQLALHAGCDETWLERYVPRNPAEEAHDALGDARWNRRAWMALRDRIDAEHLALHL